MDPLSLLILALALSLDSLTVGLLYGARRIRMPWGALLIVSIATGLLLGIAMGAGRVVASVLPPEVAGRLGALVLACVGAWITYQTWRSSRREPVRTAEPAPAELRRVWRLQLGSVGIVIEILREPGAADLDRSGHINPLEACFLGIALALDSMAAGLGAAMAGYPPFGLPVAATVASFVMMLLGTRCARYLPFRLEGRWSMLHGVMLMLLGLYRMVV